MSASAISIGLSAAIVSVERERPLVLVVAHDGTADALPFGPFNPVTQRTLESAGWPARCATAWGAAA